MNFKLIRIVLINQTNEYQMEMGIPMDFSVANSWNKHGGTTIEQYFC